MCDNLVKVHFGFQEADRAKIIDKITKSLMNS